MTILIDIGDAFIYVQRQQGWHKALRMAWKFLQDQVYEKHDGFVLCKSLDEPITVPNADIALEIRQIRLDDLELLKTIMPTLRVKRIEKKIQSGEICYAAIKNDEVIGYVLAGFEGTPSTRHAQLQLNEDEAYLWSGYTLPQYRRKKVVKVINLSLCHLLQERGYKKVLLLVEKVNQASLGHCFKMDYQITHQITYRRIINWTKCQITPEK